MASTGSIRPLMAPSGNTWRVNGKKQSLSSKNSSSGDRIRRGQSNTPLPGYSLLQRAAFHASNCPQRYRGLKKLSEGERSQGILAANEYGDSKSLVTFGADSIHRTMH